MRLNELLNKAKNIIEKTTEKTTEKTSEKITETLETLANNWQKKLAYFYQELMLMIPTIELKNLFLKANLLRIGFLVAMLMTLPQMCTAQQPTPTPAPAGGSLSVTSVAKNAFTTIYDDWRLPVCALLFFVAIFFYFQGGEQGLVRAIGVVVGMVVWALVPYFRDTVFSWFGQKLN